MDEIISQSCNIGRVEPTRSQPIDIGVCKSNHPQLLTTDDEQMIAVDQGVGKRDAKFSGVEGRRTMHGEEFELLRIDQ